jgi:hypothetical protein
MGYYTDFKLNAEPAFPDNFEEKFYEITDYSLEDYELNGKWYDWNDDMINLSKIFPNTLFTVDGTGEENEDIWRAYFKNGESKTVEPIMTWPEVDLSEFGKKKKYI